MNSTLIIQFVKIGQTFLLLTIIFLQTSFDAFAQETPLLPKIAQEKLLRDFDLMQEGLEQFHTGLYWYTSKDSFDRAFQEARNHVNKDMNVLEFHQVIAPIISLTREDHTNLEFPESLDEYITTQATFFPLIPIFLDRRMYVVGNASKSNELLERWEVLSINDESISQIMGRLGRHFASDGYITRVKYTDLNRFEFCIHYFLEYGNVESFKVELKRGEEVQTIHLQAENLKGIRANTAKNKRTYKSEPEGESLEYRLLNDSVAYLGIHTFGTSSYKHNEVHRNYRKFLDGSFGDIEARGINHVIIDVSENGGGNEGNENLLYSYLGENYQKYTSVTAKAQKVKLDNGIDRPIKLKTFGWLERTFANRKLPDGSYSRKPSISFGLKAYQKEPSHKYNGKLYVMISPVTYSGGSEFANMIFTRQRGIFFGEETGGGFYGNTSGYGREVHLPNSGFVIDIPALKFEMNVSGLPKGSGVLPHHQVIPTIDQYYSHETVVLNYILRYIAKGQ